MKPQTEIRNLRLEVKKLRVLCMGLGCPMLIAYLPDLAIKDIKLKEPRKLSKTQTVWLKEKMKEFKKLK